MSNLKIDQAVRLFAEFMNSSWTTVIPLLVERPYTTDEDALNDWIEANWELLVERKVLQIDEYLEPYGEGADFNAPSSRITAPDALSTFGVEVNQATKEGVYDCLNDEHFQFEGATFMELVGFKKGFYTKEPIFKYVLIKDSTKTERVVSIDDVRFQLYKMDKQ